MSVVDWELIPQEDKEKALEAIISYARQNPVKYALKKDALLAKYGLTSIDESVVEIPESEDIKELKKLKKK